MGKMLSKVIFKILALICLGSGIFSAQGCVYLVVGSVGAIGGYVVSPDTVEGTVERDFQEVWDSSFRSSILWAASLSRTRKRVGSRPS